MVSPTPLPAPTGTSAFLKAAAAAREDLLRTIPADLHLPDAILSSPTRNVMDVPASCGLMTREELAITEMDATGIRDAIAAGSLSAVSAVTAFGKRAAIAHQLICCLTEFFLDEGIAQAQKLDDYFAAHGKVVGPLHGVPISIKEHINIKGHMTGIGFKSGTHLAEEDADIIKILRQLGAVLYVKTNQPQTIMHLETHSWHGRSLNPHNRDLTPGGSSGGESGLVAFKGSCLGIGTDGGGSIRQPSANTGIFGLKPSCKLLPTDGYEFYMPGADSFGISTGPMCGSARDVELFMSSICDTRPALHDPTLIPVPWQVPARPREGKIRVGFMRHDGVVLPHPPTLRGLDHVLKKLEASGEVDLVEWKPYRHREIYDNMRVLYFEDGGKDIKKHLEQEGEDALELTKWLFDNVTTEHTLEQAWKARSIRNAFRKEYAQLWRSADLDVLLCPPFTGTACPHDKARYWGYTAVYNNLDYPGLCFPTGLYADPTIDVKTDRKEFMQDTGEKSDRYNHELYEPEVYDGAPISLQLLAFRLEDCKLMSAYKIIEAAMKA